MLCNLIDFYISLHGENGHTITQASIQGLDDEILSFTAKDLKDCILCRYFHLASESVENFSDVVPCFDEWQSYFNSNVNYSDPLSIHFNLFHLAVFEITDTMFASNTLNYIFSKAPMDYSLHLFDNENEISSKMSMISIITNCREIKPDLCRVYFEIQCSKSATDSLMNIGCVLTGVQDATDVNGKPFKLYGFRCSFNGQTWNIQKRFSDFSKLHSILSSQKKSDSDAVPNGLLPSLPSKLNSCVEYRKENLERYLRQLLSIVANTTNRHILSFVGLLNESYLSALDLSPIKSTLHISKLITELDTGDLILFKSTNPYSQVQRVFTGSTWDHIGIVVRVTRASYLKMRGKKSSHRAATSVGTSQEPCTKSSKVQAVMKKSLQYLTNIFPSSTSSSTVSSTSTAVGSPSSAKVVKATELPGVSGRPSLHNNNVNNKNSDGWKVSSDVSGGVLCVLESTGDGVTLLPLTPRIKSYDHYKCCDAIAIRRLNIDDNISWEQEAVSTSSATLHRRISSDIEDKLSEFLNAVVGLPYEFRVSRVLISLMTSSKESSSGPTSSVASDQFNKDLKNSYFCSEVVAAFLKVMGLLPLSLKDDYFWPGSFSEGDVLDRLIPTPNRYGGEIFLDCRVNEVSTLTSLSQKELEQEEEMDCAEFLPVFNLKSPSDRNSLRVFQDYSPKSIAVSRNISSEIDAISSSSSANNNTTATATAAADNDKQVSANCCDCDPSSVKVLLEIEEDVLVRPANTFVPNF